MTGDGIERAIGKLEGKVDAMRDEVKEVKEMTCVVRDSCMVCREGFNLKIMEIKKVQNGKAAVASWWDSTLTRWAIIIGIGIGISGFIFDVVRLFV